MKYNPHIVRAWFLDAGLPHFEFEYKFHPTRKWRFDIAWVEQNQKLALEVQGGIWGGGRHSRGAAMLLEWQKLNAAAALGWRILYCQPQDVCTTELITTIKTALAYHKP